MVAIADRWKIDFSDLSNMFLGNNVLKSWSKGFINQKD
jgi:hypothetical protein